MLIEIEKDSIAFLIKTDMNTRINKEDESIRPKHNPSIKE